MINNGGVVIILTTTDLFGTSSVNFGQWIPIKAPAIELDRSTALDVTEGGSAASYRVKLSVRPTGNVRTIVDAQQSGDDNIDVRTSAFESGAWRSAVAVVFTTSNWNTWQTVEVRGWSDADAIDAAGQIRHYTNNANSPAEYDPATGPTLTVNVADDDATIAVSRGTGALALTEGGSAGTYSVSLGGLPDGNVVVRVSSSDDGAVTVNKDSGTAGSSQDLTFTTSNWNNGQNITLAAVGDGDTQNESVTITHAVVDGSSVSEYDRAPDVDFTATVTDAGFGVRASSVSGQATEAGGTATFTVRLESRPSADVAIAVSSGDTGEGTVSPTSLTFTTGNWASPRTVTVTGVDDDDIDGSQSYDITLNPSSTGDANYNGLANVTVSVTTTDGDTAGITTGTVTGTITEAGGQATFTVELDTRPLADVTIAVSSGDGGEGSVSPASLTFTRSDWSTTQTVTVTGQNDDVDDGDQSYDITLNPSSTGDTNYNGLSDETVSVTTADDDTAGITAGTVTGTITEGGGQATFTVELDSEPEADVTVAVSSGDTGEGSVSPTSLTFTSSDWDTTQTVTVTGQNDDVADGNQSYDITLNPSSTGDTNYNGLSDETVSVTTVDDDTAGVTVSKSGVSLTEEGSDGDYTVVLNTKPSASVTVTVTSGDGDAVKVKKGAAAKANSITLTFNPTGTGLWSTPQTVTVVAEGDADSLNESVTISHAVSGSATGYPSSLTVDGVTVTVTDDDVPNIDVSPTSLALDEGGTAGTYNVKLTVQPAGNVVVEVSSDNADVKVKTGTGTAAGSVRLTFTSAASGTGSWNENQTVTVEVSDDTDLLDEIATITHSVVDDDSSNEYDNAGNQKVKVTVTDDDYAGLSIGDASASEGAGSLDFTVTKNMDSSREVTVVWTLAAGTATAGTDYDNSDTTGTLTFSSGGSLTQTISVPINDDFDVEGDETVTVTLGSPNPSGVSVGGSPATGTIVDDDEAGASVSPERSLRSTTEDNAGTVELRVALSSRPTADVEVTVTSSDTTEGVVKAAEDDPDPTLTFTTSNWNVAQAVTVTGVDDDDLDGDVEYDIRLAFSTALAPGGDPNYRGLSPVDVPFTNLDDDLSILSISGGGEVTEGDSGSSARAEFTVTLSPARRQAVSVSYATVDGTAEAGSDYASSSGTVTFSPGETSKTVTVTVNGDDEAEGNETFSVSLTETPNGQIDPQNSSAGAVIVNDDEKMVDASMSGEFSVGDTTVTVDSTLPADTGLEIVLPSELESGGSMIEELMVTLGSTDREIDSDLYGYTGTDEHHVLVDIDVSPVPDSPVKVCLPVTEGLRRAAGEQRLYLIRFSGGTWEELSSTTEGEMVCADVRGFSPFAVVYQVDFIKRRVGEVNRAILPELSRAMTASALEAITSRIDAAMAGGGAAASLPVSASGGQEIGHVEPGLRLGEFEDGETLSLLDSVDGSYFSVSLAGGGESYAAAMGEDGVAEEVPGSRSGGLGVWVSGDYRDLSGNSGSVVDWEGRLISGHLGADYMFGRSFLVGVATSWSQGSFDYTGRGESGRVSGDYGSRMNSFHPYVGVSLSRRLDVWASGGWGFGEIRMDDGEISGRQKAAARQGTLATGANLRLLGGGASALSLKGEAWIARMRVKDNGGRIEGLRVKTNRLRAVLEGTRAISLGSGSSLVPSLEFGIRRDGGDGETGVGGELGGGMTYASSFGLTVEARGRGLVFHQGDAKEWGVGGSVRFDPGADGRGLSMSVLPSYGESASGVLGLWESERAGELGVSGSEREFGLETEVAYGFSALGDGGLVTPYGALGRTGGDGRNYRAGSRLSMGGSFDVSLEARRAETGGGEPEHGLTLQGRLSW